MAPPLRRGFPSNRRVSTTVPSGTDLGYFLCQMRSVCALVTLLAALVPSRAVAADKTASLAVDVKIAPRTSLHVSSEVLTFVVPEGETTATATIEFSAAARTVRDAAVAMNVEWIGAGDARHATGDDKVITFCGDGLGTQSGVLASGVAVAARWQGSGRRIGRLIFTLRVSTPGVYSVPVKFAMTTR